MASVSKLFVKDETDCPARDAEGNHQSIDRGESTHSISASSNDGDLEKNDAATCADNIKSRQAVDHNFAATTGETNFVTAEQQRASWCTASFFYRRAKRWALMLVAGALAVSYWRGLWTLIDVYSCDQPEDATLLNGLVFCLADGVQSRQRRNNALVSYAIGLSFICIGKVMFRVGLFHQKDPIPPTSRLKAFQITGTRVLLVQVMGMGFVLSWRGVWMLTEFWLYPKYLIKSAWLSTIVGLAGCVLLQCSASLVAAPAGMLEDPSTSSFDTILSVIHGRQSLIGDPRQQQQRRPILSSIMDVLVSYIVLTILEVWCWRGVWTLQDHYFWGYTSSSHDLHWSLGMGMVVFLICIVASQAVHAWASLSVCGRRTASSHFYATLLTSRLEHVLLGVASISFWRVIWYVWEDFLGGSVLYSAWAAHIVGAAGTIVLGCFATVTFPPFVDILNATDPAADRKKHGSASNATSEDSSGRIRWFAIAARQSPFQSQ